jgi:hypothetical protein
MEVGIGCANWSDRATGNRSSRTGSTRRSFCVQPLHATMPPSRDASPSRAGFTWNNIPGTPATFTVLHLAAYRSEPNSEKETVRHRYPNPLVYGRLTPTYTAESYTDVGSVSLVGAAFLRRSALGQHRQI